MYIALMNGKYSFFLIKKKKTKYTPEENDT